MIIKKLFFFMVTFVFVAMGLTLPAQAVVSNCVVSKIGSPTEKEPKLPKECNEGSSKELVKAATAVNEAYTKCNGSSTKPGNEACIVSHLKSKGFSDKQIGAFKTRKPSTISKIKKCTECVGFVALSLSLAYSTTDTLTEGDAKDFAAKESLKTGNVVYKKASGPPKPGDIAATIAGGFGHIQIVKEVQGKTKFIGLEGSGAQCMTFNNRPYTTDGYVFFRKE